MDLKLRYVGDDGIGQLLELASFLDPQFKLAYVSDRASILKEIEKQMLKEIDIDITTCHSTSATRRPVSSSIAALPPPNKKFKGLSKVLSH